MSPELPSQCYLLVAEDTRWIGIDSDNKLSLYTEEYLMRITVDQQLPFNVNPLTSRGRAAQIDGEVKFSSSDETIATVSNTGPESGMIKPTGKPGVVQITARFDADLGEGVREITTTAAVEIVEAEATSATIEFGTPEATEEAEEEPAPTPPVEEPPPPVEEPTPPVEEPTPTLHPWQVPLELVNVPEGTTVPQRMIGDAVVNVKDYGAKGDGQTNDLNAFIAAMKALPATGGTVIVPTTTASYMLPRGETARWLRSNMRLYQEPNAPLQAIPDSDDRAYVICILDLIHVELFNPQVIGERLEHNYVKFPPVTLSDGTTRANARDTHEWGHGIVVRGKSQYVNILLGYSDKNGGDGLSCGGSDLFIYGLRTQFNRRQGITMGSAKNSKVFNCDMTDTGDYEGNEGTMPMAGIDFEPDAPNDSRNNHIYGCRSKRNRVGIEVYGNPTPDSNGDYAEVTDLLVENNDLSDNVLGASVTGAKRITFRGNKITGNDASGFQTVARVDGLVLDNNEFSRNYLRNGEPKPRDFWLAGTSTLSATNTTRDILLKGTPTNVTYPGKGNHFT